MIKMMMAQINVTVGDIENNAKKIGAIITKAQADAIDLLIFPELALTGYIPQDLLCRQDFQDAILQAIENLLLSIDEMHVVLGTAYPADNRLYNSALLLHKHKIVQRYDKSILANGGIFDEKRYFHADTIQSRFTVKGHSFALLICEDLWHEGPLDALRNNPSLAGIIAINASPFEIDKFESRLRILQDRLAAPLFYVNLVGGQDSLIFDGGSFVLLPSGDIVAQAPFFEEALLCYEFDSQPSLPVIPAQAGIQGPMDPRLRGGDVALIYRALTLAIRDFVTKNGFSSVIIGLSGGIDSALVAALAFDALGADNVETIMMPFEYTHPISIEDAHAIANNLGITHTVIPIKAAFDSMSALLAPAFKNYSPDTTEENLQARLRGILLMSVANKKKKLVLATGNKSELAVGYCTLYGDMVGAFAPIGDVYKETVYALTRYRNTISEVIPERVLTRAPSAELAPDQKDEDSLPPYPILDAILEMHIEKEMSLEDIVKKGFDEAMVKKIMTLIKQNEYKRQQAATVPKVSRRAFRSERRYPITNGFTPWKK